jgi:beta-glucosidase
MQISKVDSTGISRRGFLAAAGTAVMASRVAATELAKGTEPERELCWDKDLVRISDEAYQHAWNRAKKLVTGMTLLEKISQAGTSSTAIPRLGLPAYNYYSGEALHGLVRGAPVTAFPLPLAMACSWNPKLALNVYSAVSDEARGYNKVHNGGLSFFSPQTLNLHRDPRWGRCEEAPGEDPCLAATWTKFVLRGMQGSNPDYLKTTCTIKHFICNNTDDDRITVSASVDPRSFWEYYTRAYRACVIDADAFGLMSAYNAINGVPCTADHFLLMRLLRECWGFRGYVASDCDAVAVIQYGHHYVPTYHQAAALAMQAGCDVDCGSTYQDHLKKAVADELVSEVDIGLAVTRLLTARFLLGEFDPPERVPYNTINFDVVNSPAHQALAVEAARQSIVLLKNNDNFLPFDKSRIRKVALIGPMAGFHLGGYSGTPSVRVSPLEGVAAALGVRLVQPVWAAENVRLHGALQTQSSSEGGTDIGWITNGTWAEFPPQDFTGKTGINVRVATPSNGGWIDVYADQPDGPEIARLRVPHTGGFQKWQTISARFSPLQGKHKVFLEFSGNGGGSLFNVEWFELAPVPNRWPAFSTDGLQLLYEQGCGVTGPKDDQLFGRAVIAAREADVVIVCCGVDQSVDCEGHDRKHIRLTGVQHELIKACHAANPKTALVLSTNNTVAVNWEQENLSAIVSAIFAGQAQGTAIADVLFGDYNPGGKTCCTWYKSVDQLPPFHNYDIMAGRTYMYFDGQPLYPFGHGLSYTTFKFTDMHIDSADLSPQKNINVSCKVTNSGGRAGAEVAQFYITTPKSPVKRPIKELVGFQRVELMPGETRRITFTLPYTAQALWYWHEDRRQFVIQPGTLKLLIGSSSADIHLTGEVKLWPNKKSLMGGPQMLHAIGVPVEVA